jgi:RNA polymerase sigma-70 factor (ECF subfamily)
MRAMRDPETQALSPLVEAEVQRALDDLPAEFRLAVVLSDIEELSYKEIADAMGCPIGTVMSRLHRGRRMLQKTLREHAVAMGIVSETAEPARAKDNSPADLASYRRRKSSSISYSTKTARFSSSSASSTASAAMRARRRSI